MQLPLLLLNPALMLLPKEILRSAEKKILIDAIKDEATKTRMVAEKEKDKSED